MHYWNRDSFTAVARCSGPVRCYSVLINLEMNWAYNETPMKGITIPAAADDDDDQKSKSK